MVVSWVDSTGSRFPDTLPFVCGRWILRWELFPQIIHNSSVPEKARWQCFDSIFGYLSVTFSRFPQLHALRINWYSHFKASGDNYIHHQVHEDRFLEVQGILETTIDEVENILSASSSRKENWAPQYWVQRNIMVQAVTTPRPIHSETCVWHSGLPDLDPT